MNDLPFVAEYAKSSRASCKLCKSPIQKDTLRIGIMIQSPHFDGKIPLWHHMSCFFKKKKISTTADIGNYDTLRYEDQKMIKENMDGAANNASSSNNNLNDDFSVEYAKSSRSSCKECGEKILKGVLRISKIEHATAEALRFGPVPGWRHVNCFVEAKTSLGFEESAKNLPGYDKLAVEDKEMLDGKLKSPKAVKRKIKSEDDGKVPNKVLKIESNEEKALKSQSKLIYDMRGKIEANMSKKDMIQLLEYNNQHISTGISNLLDNLTDCLIFGSLKLCPECKSARPRFKMGEYRCSGHISEWTKCEYSTKYPERTEFKIPPEFREAYDFLKNYKYVKRERIFASDTNVASISGPKKSLPLDNFIISCHGTFKIPKPTLIKKIEQFGGKVAKKATVNATLIISTPGEVEKNSKVMTLAKLHGIHVVSPKFLEDLKQGASVAVAIHQNLICDWGVDPILKFGIKKEIKPAKSSDDYAKSISNVSGSNKVKVTVQGGSVVDPDSGLAHTTHVFQKKNDIYSVVLGKVDVTRGTNTYYKLQILASNKGSKYHLFRSWGRIGTSIGGTKLESMSSLKKAISDFEALYLEKTGNEWSDRKNFVKKPGLLYPLDIDYSQDKEIEELKTNEESKLPMPIQKLIILICDIKKMKETMVQFEIDLKKMPLGKISRKQIESAYLILTEVQKILVSGSNATKILDASNRFYTLIPHDFGLKKPPLLDNEELVKAKVEMLDSLLEIEYAYTLLSGGTNSIDAHYFKLQTDIEILDVESTEYNIIETYLRNTHADTHNMYTLKLENIFKVNRHGESERYQKFQKLHNKKLLWHGSRCTNFVGILSQGLRIAPPEAPVTGYMFGKGIYFADMVSKSANYCFTTKKNPIGLLLLCEVALGNMYERTKSEFVEKLPPSKHSTFGKGKTMPDPNDSIKLGDVEVPFGKPVPSGLTMSDLLYNEYIVYDANQVNIRYLLKVKFNFR